MIPIFIRYRYTSSHLVTYFDLDFVKWYGTQDLKLKSLHIQTEVINFKDVNSLEEWVQRETLAFGDLGGVRCVTTKAFRVDDLTDIEVLDKVCLEIVKISMLED